jgi:hypothetical protein
METTDGDERTGFRRGCLSEMREFFGVILQVIEEALKLALHGVHLFAHVENDLNAGEIYPEITRQ